MAKSSNVWDSFFEDSNGKIVIYQRPNKLFLIATLASVASLLTVEGIFHSVTSWLAIVSWVAWSVLEVLFGDSHFRKTVGFLTFVVEIFVFRYFFLS